MSSLCGIERRLLVYDLTYYPYPTLDFQQLVKNTTSTWKRYFRLCMINCTQNDINHHQKENEAQNMDNSDDRTDSDNELLITVVRNSNAPLSNCNAINKNDVSGQDIVQVDIDFVSPENHIETSADQTETEDDEQPRYEGKSWPYNELECVNVEEGVQLPFANIKGKEKDLLKGRTTANKFHKHSLVVTTNN
uniref:Uncharacterized protein n=1 Tax=Romanomermis culicivorax TaxID=13658 RepID=A0A915K4P9_ROMCU